MKVWAAVTGLNQQKEEEQMEMLVCGGGVQGVGRVSSWQVRVRGQSRVAHRERILEG